MNKAVMFSSDKSDWETPKELFDELNKEFHFTLDACAIKGNAKCERFYSPEQNGLLQKWEGRVWCNPPYGREVYKWVQKADESAEEGAIVVMLLAARTDTKWFHDFIVKKKREVRFIRGRIKFVGSKNVAPFPSMIVVFEKTKEAMKGEQNEKDY